jgi:hypothetical protein
MNNDYQNPQNDMELENMRQQMTTLKKKLEQQEIINDHFIRNSMKHTAGNINRKYTIAMIAGLLMIPYSYWVFIKLASLSVAFWLFTCVFVLICVGATYYNSRNLSDANMMTNNLVDVRRRMACAKKFDANWQFFGVPGVILFMAWFLYETYQVQGGGIDNAFFWGGVVGGIIGAILGFMTHLKTQRQYQEIIDQIEDITAEN